MKETRLSGETRFSGFVFDIEVDQVQLEDGSRSTREVVRHPGGVGVLALDEQGRAVLVRQYRYAAGREMLEIPAGRIEPEEEPIHTGLRELAEETGWRAAHCESLGSIIPTGGYCSERIWLFYAHGLTAGNTNPDEGEHVEPVYIPLRQLMDDIAYDRVQDAKTIAAVSRLILKYPVLAQ